MNRSTPGLPVHHQLPEFTQTHVHTVSDAIQPSHPLSSSSPPAPNPSQHQSFPTSQLFAWGGQSTGVSALASFLPKKSQGWSPSEWTGWISMQSKGLSRVFSIASPREQHIGKLDHCLGFLMFLCVSLTAQSSQYFRAYHRKISITLEILVCHFWCPPLWFHLLINWHEVLV